MTRKEIRNMIKEELRAKMLKEQLDAKDFARIRQFIRFEVASILFDLYKKRSTWV